MGWLLQNPPVRAKNTKIVFVLGGTRSGKSRYALSLAEPYGTKVFIATAQALDGEMAQRIKAHQRERGEAFRTIEEPYDLGRAVQALPPDTGVAVIDCLTVWLGNLLYKYGELPTQMREIDSLFETLQAPPCDLIIVSNEIGLGIVPGDKQSRRFRDVMGGINQRVAAMADEAVFMVSGLPLKLKG